MNINLLKNLMPAYPRTPHVPYNPNTSDNDIIADDASIIFNSNEVEITEKCDGANCAMKLYEDNAVIRNRDHILRKGYEKDTPAKKQFTSAWNWFYKNKYKFEKLNKLYPNTAVYGELLIALHGIRYDNLPDYFMPFDLYDSAASKFIANKISRPILIECGFNVVPLLHYGKVENWQQLEDLCEHPSPFSSLDKREGVYIKVSDDKWVTHRFKLLRHDFVQGANWNTEKLVKNKLRKA